MSIEQEIERLVACDQPDPHALLGAHPRNGSVEVRAFRPGALAVRVHAAGREPVALHQSHPAGVFDGVIEG
ncbi:MAG TPA: hypothetical protein VHM66_08640, partial [Solirubrobacterales bacterium]|nr:hypothetical protein [Solirubrobacterales bacterium]